MLLCGAFPLSEAEVMEIDDHDQAVIESRLKRKQLLEEFPNYELLAVHSVSLFLVELFDWTEVAEGTRQCSSFRLLPRLASKDGMSFATQMKQKVLLSLKAQKSFYLRTKQEAQRPLPRIWTN
jgi:hypothetical protein